MSARPTMILVDTNVWLDNYLPDRSGSHDARRFLSEARRSGATLVYPAPIVRDVFYIIDANLKRERRQECGGVISEGDAVAIREIAWACVDNMRELATAVGLDESDLWLACKYRTFNRDLEDNIVLAAAKRAPVDYLVTSDRELLVKATIPALCPADMVALIQAEYPSVDE